MTSSFPQKYGQVTAILGGQWGDEGKGKLIDIMAKEYDIVARGTGGANAGHTVYIQDPANPTQKKKIVFHLMPSGMLYPHMVGVIGNGCVVHLPTFFEEFQTLKENGIDVTGRIFISDRAHLVLDYHKIIDKLQEEKKGKNKVGTTGRGIGPAYADKISRNGIRACDLLDFSAFEKKFRDHVAALREEAGSLMPEYDSEKELEWYRQFSSTIRLMIKDTSLYLNNAMNEGKNILLEGANATLLDIDHGTYPFVTSSNASIGGLVTGLGIGAMKMTSAIAVMKAYCTRVGAGSFPTELTNELGEKMRSTGGEFGSTTGRPRRCGWFDAVGAKYSIRINGMTSVNLTKLDVLDDFDTINVATKYLLDGKELESFPSSLEILEKVEVVYEEFPGWKEDISKARTISELPKNARQYVQRLEELMGCPVEFVGVGVGREEMAVK